MPTSNNGNLFTRYRSPNPGANVPHIYDDFLTDTICSDMPADMPAIDGGQTLSQCFLGRKSKFNHCEKTKTTKYYLTALHDCVRTWGAPDRVLCDHVKYQSSSRVLDYLRLLWIGLWQSEAKYQHQNKFERRFQTLKHMVNRLMDRIDTPPQLWFLALVYCMHVLNHSSDPTVNSRQPIFVATRKNW